MSTTLAPASLATHRDPPGDPEVIMVPGRMAMVLQIAQILTDYGRHLNETIEHRVLWPGFATIARFFGTAKVSLMLPRIQRGIMRAVALERMLMMRARSGCDLKVLARPVYKKRPAKPAAQPAPGMDARTAPGPGAQPASATLTSAPPAQAAKAVSPGRRIGANDPVTFETLPFMAQIEAEVRRRPVGQTVVDICRDLGVSPVLCSGPFWDQISMVIYWYRGSFNNIMLEMRRREIRLDKDTWRYPKLGLPENSADGVRKVLGFLIGETPVVPFRPARAAGGVNQPASADAPAVENLTRSLPPDAPVPGDLTQTPLPDASAVGNLTHTPPPDASVVEALTRSLLPDAPAVENLTRTRPPDMPAEATGPP